MKTLFNTRTYFVLTLAILVTAIIFSSGTESQNAQTEPIPQEPPYKGRYEKYSRPDELTQKIRDASSDLVRVRFSTLAQKESFRRTATVIQDLGSEVVVITENAKGLERAGLQVQRLESTVHLPRGSFDPLLDTHRPTVQPDQARGREEGYYVVQFGAIATDDLLDSLRDAGVKVLQYVPHQAFFVYGDGDAIAKVAGHSRVRWIGEYRTQDKAGPGLLSAEVKEGIAAFDIAVFANVEPGRSVRSFRERINGRVIGENRMPSNFFNVIRVEMPPSELDKALALPGVFRVDSYVKPTAEDERAAQIVAGNYSSTTVLNAPGYNPQTQFGVDGTGVTIGMVDDGVSVPGNGGFYVTSNNTVHGPLRGAAAGATGGHGHINASIIAGNTPFGILDPTGYNYGLGIAPKSNIVNIPFLVSGNTTTDSQAVDDTLLTFGPNGANGTITNNSWGSGTNGNSYDSFAATYDALVRDASISTAAIDPFTIIFSAGNSGTSGLTRPKMSKNTISVANAENVRPEFTGTGADNMDDLRSSSSRGPAADGRMKPDITAPGTVITGSRAGNCSSVSLCFDENHAYSTGTSHAAPQIAGVAALFTEYWRDNNAGANPRPSLIKAAIINTAQEMNGSLTTEVRPNGAEGWGRVHLKSMLNAGVPILHVNESHAFSAPAESTVYSGAVIDPAKPFRVSLVWTDPPGTGNPALVNNLDLTVNVGGAIYRGNVFVNGNSTTGGSNSTVDNVENVFLPSGIAPGTAVTITVSAAALNGDGILGNADTTDQHFSLVAYNFGTPETNVRAPYDFTGDGKSDIGVFRSTEGSWWYSSTEAGGGSASTQFGTGSDVIVPADFTGDGKADVAVWRGNSGEWFVLRSEDSTYYSFAFGSSGDIPAPGDFDADGKADSAVFRPSNGTWFIGRSTGGVDIIQFGANGDRPAVGNYDGDDRADLAIYRPNGANGGEWWINRSSGGVHAFQFGSSTDKIVPGDYTGDGKTDAAFWRPASGEWYVLRSEDSSFFAFPFGQTGDVPVPADYDGDGKYDPAVFRPTGSLWYISRTTAGAYIAAFGFPTDTPIPSAYVR